jgi:hypothetical protein
MWKKVLSKIEKLHKDTSELKNFISELPILSREDLLEQIQEDILMKNIIYQEESLFKKKYKDKTKKKISFTQNLIDKTIADINQNPVKKVFFLRKFIDKFSDISESDKNVVLKSLENTGMDDLREKMDSLIKTFKMKDPEEFF